MGCKARKETKFIIIVVNKGFRAESNRETRCVSIELKQNVAKDISCKRIYLEFRR